MSILELIWDFFRAPKPVPIPETSLIDGVEMGQILKPYCQNIWQSDSEYRLMDTESLIEFLRINPVNSRKYITEFHDCPLPIDYAYALGLFFADGSCGFRQKSGNMSLGNGASWRIVGDQKNLERAKKGLEERMFADVTFDIRLYESYKKGIITNYGRRTKDTYCLDVLANKHGDRIKFIKEFHKLFYRNKEKKTPSPIMECNMESKKSFLEGVLDGDGTTLSNEKKGRLISHKLGIFGLIKIMKDIWWNPTLSKENRTKKPMYYIGINQKREPYSFILEAIKNTNKEWVTIQDILPKIKYNYINILGYIRNLKNDGYIVTRKNNDDNRIEEIKIIKDFIFCDDYSYELMGDVSTWNPAGAFGIVWGNRAGDGAGHAWNFFVDENKKVKFVEPQTDTIFDFTNEIIWIMII